jgi:hypothetical protein
MVLKKPFGRLSIAQTHFQGIFFHCTGRARTCRSLFLLFDKLLFVIKLIVCFAVYAIAYKANRSFFKNLGITGDKRTHRVRATGMLAGAAI